LKHPHESIPVLGGSFVSPFYLQLYQYIQQIVYKRIQWHVHECPVELLCN
jgi:hypothetical protein